MSAETELRLEFYTRDGQDVYLGAFLVPSGGDGQLIGTAGDHGDGPQPLFRDVPFADVEEFLDRCKLKAMSVGAKLVVDPEVLDRGESS